MRLPEPYLKHRTAARKRFSFCSPFRLGIAVGEAGEDLPAPYPANSAAAARYDAGVDVGRDRAAVPVGMNFVFCTGDPNPLRAAGDRRFWPVTEDGHGVREGGK
jgi:hypothetical protein